VRLATTNISGVTISKSSTNLCHNLQFLVLPFV
jgi:hypothetical protein